jgi:hypothetical protein
MTLLLTHQQKLRIAAHRMREMAKWRAEEIRFYLISGRRPDHLIEETAALQREACEVAGLEGGC